MFGNLLCSQFTSHWTQHKLRGHATIIMNGCGSHIKLMSKIMFSGMKVQECFGEI